jgi:two-component system nitrate/nitrite response regulator NarL
VRSEPPRRSEVLKALLRGACAVMSTERVATDLVPACTLATHGHVTVEAGAARELLDALRAPSASPSLPELTSRELDILRLIARGLTVRQTARTLGIAAKTVENTQSRLYRKLGARNRSGALVAAHALGLLEHYAEAALGPSSGFVPGT